MEVISTNLEQILLIAQGFFLFIPELGQRVVESIVIDKLAQDIGGIRG
jgi:predicted fused transcriptional regulator/phosphomethylpyrimidine kinase